MINPWFLALKLALIGSNLTVVFKKEEGRRKKEEGRRKKEES
jgi:hypothetical protein